MLAIRHHVTAERNAYSLSISFHYNKFFSGLFSIYFSLISTKIILRKFTRVCFYCYFIVCYKTMFKQGSNHIKLDVEYVFAARFISQAKLHHQLGPWLVQFRVVLDPAGFHSGLEMCELTRLVQNLLSPIGIHKTTLLKIKSKEEDLLYSKDYQH